MPALRTRQSLNGPTEHLACYCRGEAKAAGTAEVQKNSGTCLGRRRRGWVLGEQNQFISAGGKHALSRFEARLRKCGWYGLLVH